MDARRGWLRSWVTWCVAAAVAVRLPLLAAPVGSDEGGLLLVGESWGSGGDSLYGAYWVDRPPLLVAVHELAAVSGGIVPLRIIGCLAAVVTILAAWQVGRAIAGPVGGRWSAVMATAVVSAPTIALPHVSSELLATPFVLGSVVLTLRSVDDHDRGRWALAAAAGALAVCAPLLKQNLVDALLAVAVIVVVAVTRGLVPRRRAMALSLAAVAGAAATVAVVAGWTAFRGTQLTDLWQALVPFRAEAGSVISQHATEATTDRFVVLAMVFVAAGPLAVTLLAARTARRAPSPATIATIVLLTWAVVSIVAGGSYWRHYLLQLHPGLTMAVATASTSDLFGRRAARALSAFTAAASLVAVTATTVSTTTLTTREVVGQWLNTVTYPGDTAVVAWGKPSILHEAGVTSPYEQLWSLPVRVRDPELTEFVDLLRSSRAPDWVLSFGPSLDSWGIDARSADRVVRDRYDVVARVCGYRIHLRKGVTRPLPDGQGADLVECPDENSAAGPEPTVSPGHRPVSRALPRSSRRPRGGEGRGRRPPLRPGDLDASPRASRGRGGREAAAAHRDR